jgi:hypothetical protein
MYDVCTSVHCCYTCVLYASSYDCGQCALVQWDHIRAHSIQWDHIRAHSILLSLYYFILFFLVFRASGGSGSGGVAATSAGVEQDVLDKLREFDIEEAAGPLAQHGFKKMRTLQKMEERFPKDMLCYLFANVECVPYASSY